MSDQSETMGRSDDEEGVEEVPMKNPATASSPGADGAAHEETEAAVPDESFLDDDFLCFSAVDNGGDGGDNKNGETGGANANGGRNGQLAGRKRGRSASPVPRNGGRDQCVPATKKPSVPWLDDTNIPAVPQPPPPPPPQQQWGRNRGYGSNNAQYRAPPPAYNRTPPLIRLHNEIVSFVKLMEPTAEELGSRDVMVGRVTEVAHRAFGGEDKVRDERRQHDNDNTQRMRAIHFSAY